jgi:hypothetical protein
MYELALNVIEAGESLDVCVPQIADGSAAARDSMHKRLAQPDAALSDSTQMSKLRPGDVHLHFFGTATLSCADGIDPEPGDVFEVDLPDLGAPLRAAWRARALAY